jgi:antitoxin component YwqK of YwqJK toxin-antitoxin module
MRKILVFLFIFFPFICSAQEQFSRRIIIKKPDTSFEIGDAVTDYDDTSRYYMIQAISMPFQVLYFSEHHQRYSNGLYFSFYDKGNMPKSRGYYVNGDKDGNWYYWGQTGRLLRKELWKKGRLIEKKLFH